MALTIFILIAVITLLIAGLLYVLSCIPRWPG